MASHAPAAPVRFHLVPIVALALVLRVAVVWMVARSHSSDWFFSQATELGSLTENLRAGHGLSSPFGGTTGPSAFLAPGYPALVASIFILFGSYSFTSEVVLMLLQAVFGAATVATLMLLTRRAFGSVPANLAGVVCALCPPAIFLPTLFWETTLSVLLATVLVLLALAVADSPTTWRWVGMGLFAAAVLTTNPSLLPILAGSYGWAVWRTRRTSLRAAALGVLLCLLLSTPWVVRNQRQLHAFVPLRSNMGYELWQGNKPGSDGFFLASLHPNVNAVEFARYSALGEIAYMREKSVQARAAIAADPPRFFSLTLKRAAFFWIGRGRISSGLVVLYLSLTSGLGFFGLWRLWGLNRALASVFLLPLLLFPLPYYITHPDFRFRLIIDPLMLALAAYAFTDARLKQEA